jgi:predicted secreted protein
MASLAVSGVGSQFLKGSAALAEITNITGPSMTRDFIDVTSLDSEDGYREFITGFRDAGTISLNMNFTEDSYAVIKLDFESPVAQTYSVILGNLENTTFTFQGLVTECPLTIPVDDKISVDVTIKITGKVTMVGVDSSGS